jgi:hypothetical protein
VSEKWTLGVPEQEGVTVSGGLHWRQQGVYTLDAAGTVAMHAVQCQQIGNALGTIMCAASIDHSLERGVRADL